MTGFISVDPLDALTNLYDRPIFIDANRPPTANDVKPAGTRWKDGSASPEVIYESLGNGVWQLEVASASDLNTLTADTGGALTPVANNLNILGTASQIETTGSGDTITLSLPAALTVPGSLTTTTTLTVGTDAVVGGNLTVTGDFIIDDITANDGAFTGTLTSAGATTLATTGASVNTFGNATGATSVAITSGTGGIALASTSTGDITIASSDTLLLDSAGVLELNSSAGAINVGNDAVAQAINVGTGAAARTITIGNITTSTGVVVNTGTGSFTVTTTGTGDIVLDSDDTMLLDSDGVLELNSSAGNISVGNDAVAQTLNLNTGAAAKVTNVGSTNTTSSTVIQSGSGGIALDGVVTASSNVILNGVATQLQVQGGAVTDFIGTAVLTSGSSGAIANTNIAAGDRIFMQRIAANASTTLGELSYAISAGASFTITSLILGTPGSPQTGDASTVAYFIVRQI